VDSRVGLTVDYGNATGGAGLCWLAIRRFSVSVQFTVSQVHPLHRPASTLVDAFTRHRLYETPLTIDFYKSFLNR
jgi:hypothetical protein